MLKTTSYPDAVIEMQNVGIRYGQGAEVLSDIKLSLKRGSFHFLTGKSGAGKTSLLSMMYLAQNPAAALSVSLAKRQFHKPGFLSHAAAENRRGFSRLSSA